ncbi:MAG: hypothetical protein R6V85_04420 [Polyangia bacterium]
MTSETAGGAPFDTVSMAEILLEQGELRRAREMVDRLAELEPRDGRTAALAERVAARESGGEPQQLALEPRGLDRISLSCDRGALRIAWELTDAGLMLGRRRVRYSGAAVVRLLTILHGPRGVRRVFRDLEIEHDCGETTIYGPAAPAVYVAALGYLGRNGAFAPLARCAPLEVAGR